MAVSEMPSELQIIEWEDPPCRNEAELAAERDEGAQRPDYWQRDGEDGTRATEPCLLWKCRTLNPTSLVGDGAFDPFNAMSIAGCAKYTSYVLNHCTFLLRTGTFLSGDGPYETTVSVD